MIILWTARCDTRKDNYKFIPSKPAPIPTWSIPATFRMWLMCAETAWITRALILTSDVTNLKCWFYYFVTRALMHSPWIKPPVIWLAFKSRSNQFWTSKKRIDQRECEMCFFIYPEVNDAGFIYMCVILFGISI